MNKKVKIDFEFDHAKSLDFEAARPSLVYELKCAYCGEKKTIRANSQYGRRRKFCSEKCYREDNRKYNVAYCKRADVKARRRKKYWDKKRAQANGDAD